jgi:membrane dipeptidase
LRHSESYVLAQSASDIERAKEDNKLAIIFDIEGGKAVEPHPGLVEILYRLGVRWMLIAYNRNNRMGGGCLDEDTGLTDYGRKIIDEMERVGMLLCCSHTGYRTAREALEYSRKPVIFSHSNPRGVKDHPRNIPDDLMIACANTGGVVSINGYGTFLGDNDNSTETLLSHIDYACELIGPRHVGLGLDYVFDPNEVVELQQSRPDLFIKATGSPSEILMVEPERFPIIAEALLARGYTEAEAQGILGHNNLRLARTVWT